MKNSRIIGIGMVLVLLMSAEFGRADTIYVHPTEGVYNTIDAAVGAAANGDEILVAPGTYQAVDVNKRLTIRSEKGSEVTKIISSGQYGVRFTSNGNDSSISGFYIKGVSYGVYIVAPLARINITNNILEGSGMYGIFLYANGGNNNVAYITIENNIISGNGIDGIYYYSSASDCYQCPYAYIRYNVVSNNIITANGSYGIAVTTGGRGRVQDNTFYNNALFDHSVANTSGVSVTAANGNIFVDPLFVDASTGNYMLQSASLSIDAGRAGSAFNDPDGTRNNMGVYGGPGAASFWPYPEGGPVITELSVTPASVPQGGTITIKATGSIR